MSSPLRSLWVALGLAAGALLAAPPASAQTALQFDGTNDYVTFGAAPSLGAPSFTLEVRFKRTGTGVATSTGTGGLAAAVPLLSKGRGEAETPANLNMNWFLGINTANNALCVDFEDTAGGLNHPLVGTTAVTSDVWHHAAATYDGTTWRIYLDGNLEASAVIGATPEATSIQHAGLGTALTSNGTAAGFFAGLLDEARVWNVVRTQAEIQANQNVEIHAAPGLVGHWALNEGAGTGAGNSVAGGPNGTLTNGPTWSTDSTVPLLPASALRFGGAPTGYVTFGDPAALDLSTFTLECWFRKDGAGTPNSTGTGGVTAVPLIAHGGPEAETPTSVNMNYFLGLRSDGVLCADFEEGAAGPSPGLNHPVSGTTVIANGAWHHAAATYDGATWRLYLDGRPEAALAVGRPVESASAQHASLGTTLLSTGLPPASNGLWFAGAIDEARIWGAARSQSDILSTINAQLSGSVPGLVARWGLDEDAARTVTSSAGTAIDGTLTGVNWSWTAGAPFDAVPPQPPAAPTALAAVATAFDRVHLAWSDNATDESGYEVERSTAGPGGPWTPAASLAADAASWDDSGRTPLAETCYRVRAVGGGGASAWAEPACATTPGSALAFGTAGTTYVTFGDPAALDLAQFTVECWFRRDGPGSGVSTGSNGVVAVPLVTHGAPEADGSNVDMNWYLGLRAADGVLCADFEEGAGGATPGSNHPVTGVTPVGSGWHHAAATYDGATWRLYLDGNLEATLAVGQPVQSATIQHAALATALTSSGATKGFFAGALDEVRVWNAARTQAEIQAAANLALAEPVPGLVARWALDEGAGTAVTGSAGTALNGTITGADYAWTAAAPFGLTWTPPAAPSGLSATAGGASRITLAWTDGSGNESGFEIERSTAGPGGPFAPLATASVNATGWVDGGLDPLTEYCYRVRAVNANGASAYDGPACATTPAFTNGALSLAGSSTAPTYAGFGNPAALRLSAFTIELWLRRDGAGEGTNTGTGGIADAIPLVAKGRAESETAATDINYLVGLRAGTGVLCADFEEGAAGAAPSQNHPIEGVTPLAPGTWHHVAATYDGTTWKLYVDGALDASTEIGQPVAAASAVAVALGSALNSTNVPAGFFQGTLDEVRIWNVARTQAEIQATANARLAVPTAGLVARWALDEGEGTAVDGSAGTTVNGAITGPAYAWTAPGAPFDLSFNQQPAPPVLVGPAHGGTGIPRAPMLEVTTADPDGDPLTVQFYGRPRAAAPGADFTVVALPDAQNYTALANGGSPAILDAQANWIVANRAARNIAYVGQLGDLSEHGDNGGDDIEWQRANAALSVLENPATTGLPDGIPYGVGVGNHDQSPNGDADGTTTFFNQDFGSARFTGRPYYGGHYGTNNDNWYDLFSAGGMDFLVLSLEYDTSPDAAVFAWANDLLTTYADRRAIVLSHFVCNTGNPGGFGPQGQAIYDALKGHANLDLMLCGHVPGEGRRQDTNGGNTVYSLLSDYQSRANGGDGWLRLLEFSPANDVIHVRTYSPWLDQYETDGDSQFDLPYEMTSAPPFELLGTVSDVPAGSNAALLWPNLAPGTEYEWYAVVTDGRTSTAGPTWSFTTTTEPVAAGPTPLRTELAPAAPSPFRSTTTLRLALARTGPADVSVYAVDGRHVATLFHGVHGAGAYTLVWNGTAADGRALPPGVYYARLVTDEGRWTRRIVRMR